MNYIISDVANCNLGHVKIETTAGQTVVTPLSAGFYGETPCKLIAYHFLFYFGTCALTIIIKYLQALFFGVFII